MGIYIQCFADIPINARSVDLPARLAESARAWARSRGIEELFFSAAPSKHGVWITFYPPNGGITFRVAGERIQVDIKTSISGPGFHAALVDLCDALERDLSLRWRWDAGGDETGYAITRDRPALETAFLEQFLAHCRFIRDADPEDRHAVNLSFGLAMDREDGVATPLGPMPKTFFVDAIDDVEDLYANAERLYPWWGADCDTVFWQKTTRALLWTDVEWRTPRTDYERFLLTAANNAARHFNLDSDRELSAALHELNDLVARDNFAPPPQSGIGYGKRRRAFSLPGRWRINLPGYYIEQSEENGETTCLWFGTEEVRGTSWTFDGEREFPWWKDFIASADIQSASCTFRLSSAAQPTKDDPTYFIACAQFCARRGSRQTETMYLTLCDARSDILARLEEIAREVWYEQPAELPSGSYDA